MCQWKRVKRSQDMVAPWHCSWATGWAQGLQWCQMEQRCSQPMFPHSHTGSGHGLRQQQGIVTVASLGWRCRGGLCSGLTLCLFVRHAHAGMCQLPGLGCAMQGDGCIQFLMLGTMGGIPARQPHGSHLALWIHRCSHMVHEMPEPLVQHRLPHQRAAPPHCPPLPIAWIS